jgi:hypothetical protein
MKIAALLESRKCLLEGGNLSIGSQEAQHLDLKVTNRNYMVPKLNELLSAINQAYAKMYKQPLWNPKVLASGEFLSGSSLHFFNVKGISDETFVAKKPTVGDIDTMVDKTKETDLQQFLTAYTNKQIGPAKFLGFQRGNEQFSGLFELQDPPVKVQIDFEFVEFEKDTPTDWAKFSHSSSWEDLQAGVKGVFHKWLIQAFTALTRKDFILRKMKGRGKLRQEVDEPMTDNMFSFAVSSKEGGGLRAKYEPVLDENGKPLVINGLPVMREAPTAGYQQNIGQIFSTILGQRLTPKQAQALQKQFWSFTGLLNVMNTLMSPEEKQLVLDGFLQKTIGPGAQGMYKNNPDKDITEKTTAINTMLQTLKLPKPANLDKMLQDYRQAYKMTGTDEGVETRRNIVKGMAKNTLDEAAPSYKRKGIQHIYNPGSSTEMKDTDFINFCKEIAQDGGKFQGVPINLKVDGAGIRFGKTAEGKPFFMTSRVDTPMTSDNIGDFEAYGRKQGQTEEQLARTQNYDKALATIVNADFMKDIPADTIVQAEMLFNPMAQQDDGGYKFVNIPYDPKKLGKSMTLVPISVKQYSTGETSPDSQKIKQALIKDSTPDIKMINNTLSHKGIDVSKIVNPIVKNAEALSNAVAQRGDTPDKQKAKAVLSKARQALSNAIIKSPIEGKDQLGDMIEGLVINMPSGTLAKVTSPDMQNKMAAKQAMNKKPTEGSNRVKPAVVTIGSFVGHKGHQQLIQQTIDTAKSVGGDPYIYVSPVMGPDDPIPPADKVKTLQALYPQYANNIQVWNPQGTPMKKIEKELVIPANSPYNKVILLVGDDRYEGMKNWMDSLEKRMKDPAAVAKYGGTQNQVDFETVRTERDPTKGGTGISFTQLRNKLKDSNASEQDKLNYWMQAFDGETLGANWIKHLMDVTAKNMGIQQQQQDIKEYIERIKLLLPHATPEQKAKIYESLVRAKAKLDEGKKKKKKKSSKSLRGYFFPGYAYYGGGESGEGSGGDGGGESINRGMSEDEFEEGIGKALGTAALAGSLALGGLSQMGKTKDTNWNDYEQQISGQRDTTGGEKIMSVAGPNSKGEYRVRITTNNDMQEFITKTPPKSLEEDKETDPVTSAVLSFYKPVVNDIHKEKLPDYVDQARELLQKTDDPKVRSKLIDIFKKGKENPYIQGGIVTTIGALLAGGILTTAQRMGLSPSQTNLALQAILNTVIPTVVSRINGKNWSDTIKYTLASAGIGTGIAGAGLIEAVSIERKESYRGRTTPDIEYVVKDANGKIIRVCKTKKEARIWYDMELLTREEMWAKYPHLKVTENTDYLEEK